MMFERFFYFGFLKKDQIALRESVQTMDMAKTRKKTTMIRRLEIIKARDAENRRKNNRHFISRLARKETVSLL